MNSHLNDDQISSAVAGLPLDERSEEHLASCLSCRREIEMMNRVVDDRRAEILADTPDWDHQKDQIMARLPAAGAVRGKLWRRPRTFQM